MKFLSKNAGQGVSHFRAAVVLLFTVLNLAVFCLHAISVWRYGALFFGAGGASSVIYPVWKAVHHLPVYSWPLQFPFSLALYNYLFYYTYAAFLKLVGADGGGIMTWGCVLTPAFALVGAWAQWKLVQTHLNLRGASSALSLFFALGLWFCASIIRGYAFAIRPDIAAAALVMIALWMAVRQSRYSFALAGLFFYFAWSFKQSVVLALAGLCLFLLLHKRWRNLSVLIAVFAALVAATLLLGTPEYRYNILVAPRLVKQFSLIWALQIAPKSLLANSYWLLAPIALLLAAGARKADPAVRLLLTVFTVALVGGLAGMTKVGAWDQYLFEAFVAGSTLLQMAVFTAPGKLVNALMLFACVQPAVQAATVPSGAHPHAFGTVGIATAAEYAEAAALGDRLALMKKPIFTTNEVFSLPWFSNDNRYPALVIDTIFHDATRASCSNGCVEGMLQRGEIPTVMLPSVKAPSSPHVPPSGSPRRPALARTRPKSNWVARKINLLKRLLKGGRHQDQLYPGATSDSNYQNSLNPNYKKVGEYPYSGRMWSLYVIEPAAQALTRSPDSTPDLKPDSKP
jgi:hypothetical protein